MAENINIEQEIALIRSGKGYSVAGLAELRARIENSDSPEKNSYLATIDKVISRIPDADLSKKEYVKKLAMHKVAVLVKELIGDRSIRRTAEDTGVAASYITGILKEKYLPSADILRKLASPEAKPQNAITLEDLMVAAGYQNDYVEEAFKDAVFDEIQDEDSGKAIDIMPNMEVLSRMAAYAEKLGGSYTPQDRHRLRMQEMSKFESLATGIVYKALAEKGIHFSNANDVVGVRGFRPDMSIYVPMQPILEWWFEYKHIGSEGNKGLFNLKHILGQFMFVEPKMERKISLVINSRETFDMLCGYKDKLAYRGDLSIILIDEGSFSVVQEEYLAHYELNKKDSEFYII